MLTYVIYTVTVHSSRHKLAIPQLKVALTPFTIHLYYLMTTLGQRSTWYVSRSRANQSYINGYYIIAIFSIQYTSYSVYYYVVFSYCIIHSVLIKIHRLQYNIVQEQFHKTLVLKGAHR